MFTGIIEYPGEVTDVVPEGTNVHLTIRSAISQELKIDQSLAHNGVCLTVVALNDDTHTVTAIAETLQKTNIGELQKGDLVNLERAMKLSDRLDGHMVQGHVDTVGVCTKVVDENGSWRFTFSYPKQEQALVVEKGSICIDGVSLTLVDAEPEMLSVAIIPYTYQHTRFKQYQVGTRVNLEFDIIGKYLAKQYAAYKT